MFTPAMHSNSQIQRRLGQTIQRILLQRWRDDGHPMHLYIWFEEGKPLSFGCAGNGEIHSIKVSEPRGCVDAKFERLHAFEGATLQDVATGSSVLHLTTNVGTILLTNDCDHLQVELKHDD